MSEVVLAHAEVTEAANYFRIVMDMKREVARTQAKQEGRKAIPINTHDLLSDPAPNADSEVFKK